MTTQANIQILKLTDGTELIATIEEAIEAPHVYLCTDILQIVSQPDPKSGQMNLALADWMPYADKTQPAIIPSSIAIVAFPSEDFTNHYRQHFGRIITPSKKLILE